MNITGFKKILLIFSMAIIAFGCQKETDEFLNIDTNLAPPVVEAGTSQVVQLPASSFTLNGTATTTNGTIRAYLWSMISGPNVPVINSPGSRITTVSSFTAGTYIFQLMATDSAGLTGVDTTHIVVNPSAIQTVTLRLASNPADWINFAALNSNDASAHDKDLNAGAWTSGGLPLYNRGAFKFDLSGIPGSATIISAKLSLYSNPTPINGDLVNANSGSTNAFYIQRITNTWNGTTATWQTQPSTSTSDQILIPHTNQSSLDLIDINVTSLVNSLRANGNYGFKIVLQNEVQYNIRQFCSSTHADNSKHPKLEITYQ